MTRYLLNTWKVIALLPLLLWQFNYDAFAQETVSGQVTDAATGESMPGVNVVVKGTTAGTSTNGEGQFELNVSSLQDTLVFSFIGYQTREVPINGRANIDVALQSQAISGEEVVVVGYGSQRKVNLTGSVSSVNVEDLENRPVANVQQALQGVVPSLQISTSAATGEPGADMNMNIRGLTSLEGSSDPYVLVDGIPMGINDIDPNDIESISVLKDAASTAIYGSRGSHGVILITTKSGSKQTGYNISYSANFAASSIINMPQNADPLSFAHAMNESGANAGRSPYYDEQQLQWIEQNMENPGSAPTMQPSPDGTQWINQARGLRTSGATDWNSVYFRDFGQRQKHNLSISGGKEDLSFYVSGGYFDELGLLKHADDYYTRYNLSAKVDAKAASWLDLSLSAKYRYAEQEYPNVGWLGGEAGRSFMMVLLSRSKPTMPKYYPGTETWVSQTNVPHMKNHKTLEQQRQYVLAPTITIEPVENWVTNIQVNYRFNDDDERFTQTRIPNAVPDGSGGSILTWPPLTSTYYRPRTFANTYLSPNIFTEYTNSFKRHNFTVLGGYQHEVYKYSNFMIEANQLLTESVRSVNTTVGEKYINDNKGHWATQGVFGRLNYDFDEKYLLEFNFRYDGSSRFAPNDRWGFFPSISSGWVISDENFYPLKEAVEFMKFRASYGSIGNQNVANYLYIPTMSTGQTNYLFGGEREWRVGTPNISSINLTWEKVNTLDFGLDIEALDNRLGITADWYESKTHDLVGPGRSLPAVLGTSVPKENIGEVTIRGWEAEISWRDQIGDFAYNIKGSISDYTQTVTEYRNPTKSLTTYYEGMKLGEIWGFETAGIFQSEQEVEDWTVDQSYLYSGAWLPGDVKYVDQDGDNELTIGDNTRDNPGDRKIIGNSSPRYQFGLNFDASWNQFDIMVYFQGVAKRDLDLRQLGTFRGHANGPLHAVVYEEHLDYWRDETSPLGSNTDAYFARPYSQFIGQNNKNYGLPTDRYLQSGAYMRLKNIQLGYRIPASFREKAGISNGRIYLSAENILTITNLMMFDPESYNARYGRQGDQYPLSRVFSLGLNINI